MFLVSAAHVFDEIHHLHFYISPGTIRKLTGRLLKTKLPLDGKRTSERLDVAVLKLEGPMLPPYPDIGKRAIPVSVLLPDPLPRTNKQYLLIGFPATRTHANPVSKQIVSDPVSFRNVSAPYSKYGELRVQAESHIVLPLDLKRTVTANRVIQSFPKPAGLSGSPLWLLYDQGDLTGPAFTPVVGVVIEHHKAAKALVATDIGVAIKLIDAAMQNDLEA